jgi:hypothetical protein
MVNVAFIRSLASSYIPEIIAKDLIIATGWFWRKIIQKITNLSKATCRELCLEFCLNYTMDVAWRGRLQYRPTVPKWTDGSWQFVSSPERRLNS